MNQSNGISDQSRRELELLLQRGASADANSAPSLPGNPAGQTLEDRVFSSTHEVLAARTPVLARIGTPEGVGRGWRIAAGVAIAGTLALLYIVSRPNTGASRETSATVANSTPTEVEYVLAAVALLDEPLVTGIEDLAQDAARLHELATSDQHFGTELTPEEKSGRQGV